jgi:hypothetical protein
MVEQLLVSLMCVRRREVPGRRCLIRRRNIGVMGLITRLGFLLEASDGIEGCRSIQRFHSGPLASEEVCDRRLTYFLS